MTDIFDRSDIEKDELGRNWLGGVLCIHLPSGVMWKMVQWKFRTGEIRANLYGVFISDEFSELVAVMKYQKMFPHLLSRRARTRTLRLKKRNALSLGFEFQTPKEIGHLKVLYPSSFP